MMKKFGLIGFPLGHSFSQKYFTEKFEKEGIKDCEYISLPINNINELPNLLKSNPDLCGLNVTIPYKIGVHYFLDNVSPTAKIIDAVNCIKITYPNSLSGLFDGELMTTNADKPYLDGHNTDAYGFLESLKPLLKKQHKKALILGNGGATRAVKYVLKKLDIDFKIVSRQHHHEMLAYTDISKKLLSEYQIIINTSPLGTYPNVNECPNIPYQYLTSDHLLYDLIYNPEETTFLRKGKDQGATIKNGYEMLVLQAEKSWEIWNTP
jgi:shikimate dehydrogenase